MAAPAGARRALEFRNGIVEAPEPAVPGRGSYVRQLIRKAPRGTTLPWYWTAPSARGPTTPVFQGLGRGTVFGPVRETDATLQTIGFISLLVPPPLSLLAPSERAGRPDLVWVNMYTNKRGGRTV